MKRLTVITITVAVLCLIGVGISVAANKGNRDKREVDVSDLSSVDLEQAVERGKEQNPHKELNDIPVYSEEDLLLDTDGQFYLGTDACRYRNQNAHMTYTGRILAAYPDPAIREKDDSSLYFVYDTDTGYRL